MQGSSVDIVATTDRVTEDTEFDSKQKHQIILFSTVARSALGRNQPLYYLLILREMSLKVKLTTHRCLMSLLRMLGAIRLHGVVLN
jgi:hypothetical protein